MSDKTWKSAITDIKPNKIMVRGYPLDELIGSVSYPRMIYLLIKGELPDDKIGKMLDAILVSSVDHGVTPPSTLAARTVTSTGAPLNSAIATGILAISKFHGGAIEECMIALEYAVEKAEKSNCSLDESAKMILDEFKGKNKKISGFGHRVHTDDPRTKKIFAIADELGISGKYIAIAKAFEKSFKDSGKALPINVDGAIAAILCEIGIPSELSNAFFMIARLPGLITHIMEEKTREKPMRKVTPDNWEYDGPTERHL
ncbi:citryl-CoA lyase [bacterium]|nr:citryl-CoA lyase [bacterium]